MNSFIKNRKKTGKIVQLVGFALLSLGALSYEMTKWNHFEDDVFTGTLNVLGVIGLAVYPTGLYISRKSKKPVVQK